jgi:hypothetical protein
MLSFERGRPIAIIKGGKYDGKIVNLFDPNRKCCENCNMKCVNGKCKRSFKCCDNCNKDTCSNYKFTKNEAIRSDPYDVLDEDFIRSHKKKLSIPEMNKIKLALEMNRRPLEDSLGLIYDKCKEEYEKRSRTELIIHDDGEVQPLPNYSSPQRLYISGPSDSGKSTYVGKLLHKYKQVYPDRDIFLLSRINNDDKLDNLGLDIMRITLNEEFLEDTPSLETLHDSIVIFDDIDSIEDKKLKVKVSGLRDLLLTAGRHENISVIVTNHLLTDYKNTKTILNEVNATTFFPKSGSSHGIKYMLKFYIGLSAKQIQRIFDLPSRWVTIYKHCPMYVIYEKGIYLL